MIDELEQKIKKQLLEKLMAEMQGASIKSLRDGDAAKITGPAEDVLDPEDTEQEDVNSSEIEVPEEAQSGETEVGTMDGKPSPADGDLMAKYKALRAMKRKAL